MARRQSTLEQAQAYLRHYGNGKQIDAVLKAAWGDFFLAEDERVRRMMHRLKVPRSCWDDVAQEVWAAIVQDLHKFQEMRPFGVWLYKVVRNKGADVIRHLVRQRWESLEAMGMKLLDGQADENVASPVNEEKLGWLFAQMGKEALENVQLLLGHLGEGKTIKQLADEAGEKPKTIERRIERLKRKWRRLAAKTFPR